MPVREALVVDAEQVEHRRLEVVDVDRILDDVVREVVRLAVDDAALHTAAGHPDAVAAGMVVAAVVVGGEGSLRVDRAAELAAPDDQGFVEQAALLQVLNQGPGRPVDVAGLRRQHGRQDAVDVPAPVVDLDESDPAFDQASRHQCRVLELAGLPRFLAPAFPRALGLARQIGHLGDRGLHAEGHLVLLDPGQGLRIADLRMAQLVQLAHPVEHASADGGRHALRVLEVEHGFVAGLEADAGVLR